MKRISFSILFTVSLLLGFAQVKMPAPSPTQFIKQDFGLSSIELTYSRPALKGRNVFGTVVLFDSLWRTGANAATKIKFNDPVEILGHKVDSGSYAIYTIPHKNGEWTFILNKGYNNSGVSGYNESEDVLRETIKSNKTVSKIESFTMQFSNVKPESCDLTLMWDNLALNVPIKVNIKDKIRAQLEAALASDKKPYWQASQFYNEYDNNKTKALEMIDAAIKQTPKPQFYMVYYKAKIQSEMGNKKGAMATAKESLELSKEAKSSDYVLLNEKLMKTLK
jgi:tetratricopeptide (TPR) repeat protein